MICDSPVIILHVSDLREGMISICVQRGYFINNIISRGVNLLTGINPMCGMVFQCMHFERQFSPCTCCCYPLAWCIPVCCIGAQGAVSEGRNTAD